MSVHNPTQIARALDQLGIELILAYSPQARGRCERLFGTWQGRLPQELRLRNITTVEAANEFLSQDWIAIHDASFCIEAQQTGTAFLPYPGKDLDKIFSQQQERVVDNDNTVRFESRCLQIPQQTFRFSLARCRVLVCQHLDQTITVHYGHHVLGHYDAAGQLFRLPAASSKSQRPANRKALMKATDNSRRTGRRKKKEPKKKEAGSLMETAAAVEIDKVAFGRSMISGGCTDGLVSPWCPSGLKTSFAFSTRFCVRCRCTASEREVLMVKKGSSSSGRRRFLTQVGAGMTVLEPQVRQELQPQRPRLQQVRAGSPLATIRTIGLIRS